MAAPESTSRDALTQKTVLPGWLGLLLDYMNVKTNKNMNEVVTIGGYEFPKASRYYVDEDAKDMEHLNIFLEKKFNKCDIKDFMSRRHPELFPGHVGLRSDHNLMLSVVIWKKSYLNPEGERDNSWYCSTSDNSANFIADILEFYEENDYDFFNFIKNRIR